MVVHGAGAVGRSSALSILTLVPVERCQEPRRPMATVANKSKAFVKKTIAQVVTTVIANPDGKSCSPRKIDNLSLTNHR